MRHGRKALGGVAVAVFALLLAGCGTEAAPTTSSATSVPEPPTSEPPDTTTTVTSVEVGPQALPAGGFLEPGEYVTTVFEPTVLYRIEQAHLLRPFDSRYVTGLENRKIFQRTSVAGPYQGVAIHNAWQHLSLDEVLATLGESDAADLGPSTPVEYGGLRGVQAEAMVNRWWFIWDRRGQGTLDAWAAQRNEMVRFIVLDSSAGTLMITVQADAELWDDFLPVAEEILAGISFPDLG